MQLSEFDFHLPAELIAQQPAARRDDSRLLYVGADGSLQDKNMRDLPELLQSGDVLVFNDTKVIPARLIGKRGDAVVEITLHKYSGGVWEAFAKRSKRLKTGDEIIFAHDFSALVADKYQDGRVILQFNTKYQKDLFEKLHIYGHMPLPPYIKRNCGAKDDICQQEIDKERYQTIYANRSGAVAAPTAGLHFTHEIMNALKERNIDIVFVTLHVGGGTFLPVKTEDISKHKMHSEWFEITTETADFINKARKNGRRIIAVGTTSLRSMETASNKDGVLQAIAGETDIFITPGYKFKTVDMLITNFHLPKSTLFMLVSAFSGLDVMRAAYQHAIERQYRFFSYGDACLLEYSGLRS